MRKNIIAGMLILALVVMTNCAFAMEGMCEIGKKHSKHERGAKMYEKTDELKSKLNLTAEQGAKVSEINQAAKEKIKAIKEDAKAKIKEVRVQRNEEIKALLTEEQKAKFKDLRKKSEQEPVLREEE